MAGVLQRRRPLIDHRVREQPQRTGMLLPQRDREKPKRHVGTDFNAQARDAVAAARRAREPKRQARAEAGWAQRRNLQAIPLRHDGLKPSERRGRRERSHTPWVPRHKSASRPRLPLARLFGGRKG